MRQFFILDLVYSSALRSNCSEADRRRSRRNSTKSEFDWDDDGCTSITRGTHESMTREQWEGHTQSRPAIRQDMLMNHWNTKASRVFSRNEILLYYSVAQIGTSGEQQRERFEQRWGRNLNSDSWRDVTCWCTCVPRQTENWNMKTRNWNENTLLQAWTQMGFDYAKCWK